MGLFDQFNNQSNEKAERAAEHRQVNYAKEQQAFATSIDPGDDNTYMVSQEKKSDLIRWQQELEPEMRDLINSFLSLRLDGDNRLVAIKDVTGTPIPPLCNELFIYQVVVPKLKPFLSRNLINSKLSEKAILRIMRATADDLVASMGDHYEMYGIKDNADRTNILRDMKNVIESSMWRAYKGFTKTTDSSMIKRVENERYDTEQKSEKKGIFGV